MQFLLLRHAKLPLKNIPRSLSNYLLINVRAMFFPYVT